MASTNPYQSPQGAGTPESSPEVKKRAQIARSIRAICILYTVFGTLAFLGGLGLLFGSPEAPDAPPKWFGWLLLIGGAAGAISAVGVLWKKSWGVPVCAIVSAVYLLSFPVGTILGGYFLFNIWKVRDQFGAIPAQLA